jgi:SesB domain on fungal death-pathway protein
MQTTFAGSGNEGLQIGQNPGTVNATFVISAGATIHTGPLGCHSYL